MKKLLLTILAMATLVGCSKDETLDVQTRSAITFEDAFVDNAVNSKAAQDGSYQGVTFNSFDVYGTITNKDGETANIFNKEKVTKGEDNKWTYDAANTQYWIPGNTYSFRALVDGNVQGATKVKTDEDGMPQTISVDASKQKDVLFAEQMSVSYSAADGDKTISFTFSHLMAKAKFTVKNTITTNNDYTYKVKNIKVNVLQKAIYNIADKSWTKAGENYTLNFGNIGLPQATDFYTGEQDATDIKYGNTGDESAYARLLIPTIKGENGTKVVATFDVELYKSGVLIDEQEKEVAAEVKLEGGRAYNFLIQLGNPGAPIKFSAHKVNSWDDSGKDNELK